MNFKKVILNNEGDTSGLGAFLGMRGVGGFTYDEGIKLDSVLKNMSDVALSALAIQLNQSMNMIKQVYPKIREIEPPKKPSSKMMKDATRFSKYSDYVRSMSSLPVDFMQAVSAINSEEGKEKNYFFYKNGHIVCKLKEDEIPAHKAAMKCEEQFKAKQLDVKVEQPNRLLKYAGKVFHTSENVKQFLTSPVKEINDVSLLETAKVVSVGQLDIKVGEKRSVVGTKNPSLKLYLHGSAKDLQVYHTTQSGKRFNGEVIEKSTIFVKDGMDTAGLGVKKNINKALIESLGLDPDTEDGAAKSAFDRIVSNYNRHKDKVNEEPFVYDSIILYNPSWLAEEFSKTKNNSVELDKFNKKYEFIFKSTPLYLGVGYYKYALKLGNRPIPIPSVIFMNAPSMCERFVGYYNLYRTFYDSQDFSVLLDRFVKYQQLAAVGKLLKEMLYYSTQRIDFTVDFHGVSKKSEDKGTLAADLFNKDYKSDSEEEDKDDSSVDNLWGDEELMAPRQPKKKKTEPDIENKEVQRDPEVDTIKKEEGVLNKDNRVNRYAKKKEQSSEKDDLDPDEDWDLETVYASAKQDEDCTEEDLIQVKKSMGRAFTNRSFKGLQNEELLLWYLRAYVVYANWEETYMEEFCQDYSVQFDTKGPLKYRARTYVQSVLGVQITGDEFEAFENTCTFESKFTKSSGELPTNSKKNGTKR